MYAHAYTYTHTHTHTCQARTQGGGGGGGSGGSAKPLVCSDIELKCFLIDTRQPNQNFTIILMA